MKRNNFISKNGHLIDRCLRPVYLEDFGVDESSDSSDKIIRAFKSLRTGQLITTNLSIINFKKSVNYSFSSEQMHCSIFLPCHLIFDINNTQSGFLLEGNGNTLGVVTLGPVGYCDLRFRDVKGSRVGLGVGVELRNFWQTDFDIYRTMNFMTGVRFVGGGIAVSGNGSGLCKLRIRQAFCPKITNAVSLELTTLPFNSTGGYLNSTEIECNFLRGQNGIRFTKGEFQSDRFNGHEIVNTSIENIVDTGIDMRYCGDNVVNNPRFEGGHVPGTWIQDDEESVYNTVITHGSPDCNLIRLTGHGSKIIGDVKNSDGTILYSQVMSGSDESDVTGNDHTIQQSNRLNGVTPNNTVFWGGIPGQFRWSKYAGGVRDMNGEDKVFGLLNPYGCFSSPNASGDVNVPSGVSFISMSTTGASNVVLNMSQDREENGLSIHLELTYFTNDISVKKSTGTTTIAEGVINSTGLWLLIYKGDTWKTSRIGDKLK